MDQLWVVLVVLGFLLLLGVVLSYGYYNTPYEKFEYRPRAKFPKVTTILLVLLFLDILGGLASYFFFAHSP